MPSEGKQAWMDDAFAAVGRMIETARADERAKVEAEIVALLIKMDHSRYIEAIYAIERGDHRASGESRP